MRLFYRIENFNWFVGKLCRIAKNNGRGALYAPYTLYICLFCVFLLRVNSFITWILMLSN